MLDKDFARSPREWWNPRGKLEAFQVLASLETGGGGADSLPPKQKNFFFLKLKAISQKMCIQVSDKGSESIF